MLHPMGPHPQSMGFQPKTETNAADYQVSELKLNVNSNYFNRNWPELVFLALKQKVFPGKTTNLKPFSLFSLTLQGNIGKQYEDYLKLCGLLRISELYQEKIAFKKLLD